MATIELGNNLKMLSNFVEHRQLDKGAYGSVSLVLDKVSRMRYALKTIKDPSSECISSFKREIRTLSKVIHKHIIKLISYGTDSENFDNEKLYECFPPSYLVLDYASNGALFDYIVSDKKGFSEAIVRNIFAQILDGVEALHNNKIAHGDLKTENILLDEHWSIKVCDLGNSYELDVTDSNHNPLHGSTMGYTSPEVLHQTYFNCKGNKSDVFSLGVILFILVTGSIPFRKGLITDTYYKLIVEHDPSLWSLYSKNTSITFSDDFRKLFQLMVHPNPDVRPTIKEIKKSAWMNNIRASNEEVQDEFFRRKLLKLKGERKKQLSAESSERSSSQGSSRLTNYDSLF